MFTFPEHHRAASGQSPVGATLFAELWDCRYLAADFHEHEICQLPAHLQPEAEEVVREAEISLDRAEIAAGKGESGAAFQELHQAKQILVFAYHAYFA